MEEQPTRSGEHDAFDDESWPLAQAAAWIIWRSRERVASIIEAIAEQERSTQIFDVFNQAARRAEVYGSAPEGGVLSFKDAQADLWGHLIDGRLHATGVRIGESFWSNIPAEEWRGLDYLYCSDGRSNSIGSNGEARYDGVDVARSKVLMLWPPQKQDRAFEGASNLSAAINQIGRSRAQHARESKLPPRLVDRILVDTIEGDPKAARASKSRPVILGAARRNIDTINSRIAEERSRYNLRTEKPYYSDVDSVYRAYIRAKSRTSK